MKMSPFIALLLLVTLLSATAPLATEALNMKGQLLESKTFRSPPISLRPGSASNKFYHHVAFPTGHVAVKSFNAEVVDEAGVPVPLHETYLHHWLVEPYYAPKDADAAEAQKLPKRIMARNSGVCKTTLGQYYGLGSETRHTATWVPDPYGIEIGNPERPPEGYEERWMLNVHAIDTRGVTDKLGCTECRCDLYNVTVDEYGRRVDEDYTGGLRCCYDQSRCKVKEGFENGEARKVFLRYTVTWLDWSDAVLPVKIYIFDVSDTALLEGKSEPACKVEYQVEECSSENRAKNDCVHVQATKQVLPRGGDIVFGVAHQHSGGIGASLHGEDGRLLCKSIPTYGKGQQAGDEAGYIVGMSTCYPKPGTVTVRDGEVLTLVSNYSSERQHTGVMGLFYILVAEHEQQQLPAAAGNPGLCFSFPVPWCIPSWLSSNLWSSGDKMMSPSLVLLVALLSATTATLPSEALNVRGHLLKTKTFLSPPIFLRPGSVSNKFYLDIPFPRGHLALKSFNGEVVDERGVPVPLHETYLHHWVVEPYFAPGAGAGGAGAAEVETKLPKVILNRNSGVCKTTLGQYYGLGSETRHTATWVPDPYGIEIGNPPEGYEERWLVNVHAIDTRGVADKLGCTECRCDLYNATVDEYGRRIAEDYTGGLRCCYDQTQCRMEEGFAGGEARKVFLRYTVTWLDWSDAVLPVKIYIFDVTDRALLEGKSEPACKVEYQVEECSAENRAKNDCVHVQATKQVLPRGGDIVFGVAHQHSGGIGASLHGEDGRLLCESMATYGEGQEAGNEEGYIVGMSTCYPKPGSVTVFDGEVLTIVSNYSSERQHTGVMGLFYILVAEHDRQQQQQQLPAATDNPGLCFSFPVSWCLPSWLSSNL
ncbi:hypothetical protein BAE44_0023389 [Dichanthelium oligosanthes]|uniref:Stress up-regulated Nod 19 n=1 Tax=Dichanthelium oligosanthes TaxID=888268 RepID=A0A1E5URS8_9POAL|nr:hypothetical protein BAE44_0023389 [Dichanthelium oligosanthes]